MGVANGHKPSPNYAGVMFCSQHRCRRPLLNTDKGQLCQIWFSQIAMQVERHHFIACLSLRENHMLFRLFRLFDSESHGRQSINISSFIDIRILIVAQHGPSEAPKLIHTSIPHFAVATSLSLRSRRTEKRSLAILGILRELATRQ